MNLKTSPPQSKISGHLFSILNTLNIPLHLGNNQKLISTVQGTINKNNANQTGNCFGHLLGSRSFHWKHFF